MEATRAFPRPRPEIQATPNLNHNPGSKRAPTFKDGSTKPPRNTLTRTPAQMRIQATPNLNHKPGSKRAPTFKSGPTKRRRNTPTRTPAQMRIQATPNLNHNPGLDRATKIQVGPHKATTQDTDQDSGQDENSSRDQIQNQSPSPGPNQIAIGTRMRSPAEHLERGLGQHPDRVLRLQTPGRARSINASYTHPRWSLWRTQSMGRSWGGRWFTSRLRSPSNSPPEDW